MSATTRAPIAHNRLVLTPYGLVPASDVVQVDNHETVRIIDGQPDELDQRTGTATAHPGAVRPARRPPGR